jgi:hypothetical protein
MALYIHIKEPTANIDCATPLHNTKQKSQGGWAGREFGGGGDFLSTIDDFSKKYLILEKGPSSL